MTSNQYHPLNEYVKKKPLDIDRFLHIAIEICQGIYALHKQNFLFNHLSPSTILINEKEEVKISHITLLDDREVTLDYLSPEHALHDLISINQSSDIYVLGIIFYELLIGELPYRYDDALEFNHAIITQKIDFVSDKNKNVPHILSMIIDKMVATSQLDRYKDIRSVLIDLSKLQRAFNNNEFPDFQLDTFQNIQDLHTSEMIYGREKEEEKLQYHIDLKSDNVNKIILVQGKSGMGKSSFINKVIDKNKNNFSHICKFKLDSGEQSTPYQILYITLSTMVREIISQDEKTLKRYRNKLLSSLGEQAYMLTEVIPEIHMILGQDPSTEHVKNKEQKVNLDNLLVRFMQIFLLDERPLCIFADDIQWADVVTLQWIKSVILNLENVIVFMAYRDDETEISDNPLFGTVLQELKVFDLKIYEMTMSPLSKDHIETLIRDNIQLEVGKEVADIIFERTRGNPFFVKEYLKQLYKDDVIWFDMQQLEWRCDLHKINALQISDNVFDMLSNNIDSLSPYVRNLLCIASCMGNTFSHELLKNVFNQDELFEKSLALALASGWIVIDHTNTLDEKRYRFLHDKMQHAIHNLLLGKVLHKVHYKIGCQQEQSREVQDHQNLLECVNHLNIGSAYVRDKKYLAKLNLDASIYAKKSGDFESALKYIKKAMEFYCFNHSVENTVLILKQRAECEHLCNHSGVAIEYYEKALEVAQTILQKGEIYELLIKLYSDIAQFKNAYEVGRVAAESFGILIPKTFVPPLFISEFLGLKLKLRRYSVEDLIELPESNDENFKMTIKIMANILQAAYQIRPALCVANAMIIVKLCLEHGLTKESVIGFTVYGVIFEGGILRNHKLGYAYSRFSFDMLKRFENTTQHAEVQFVCGYFGISWIRPAMETEEVWHNAYKNGLEIGDWFHTGCAAAGIIQSMFMRGVAFEDILIQIKDFEKIILDIGAKEQYGAILSVKQTILNLTGKTKTLHSYDSDNFDESSYVESLEDYESEHFAHYYYVNKMTALYLQQAYKEAHQISLQGKKFAKSSKGMLHHTEYLFYDAMILAKLIETKDILTRRKYKNTIENVKKKFVKWAGECAENFLVRANILQAELYRIENNYKEAFLYYEKAIDLAQIYGQRHLRAITNRLAAELYETLGQKRAVKIYKDESLRNFNKWGINYIEYTGEEENLSFDVKTLIKVSEVIAQEHEFSSLLKTLIRIIMESAGAQHGHLLLKEDSGFVVQASANEDFSVVDVMQEIPYTDVDMIVHPIINYVLRTKESIVIDDMTQNNIFDTSYVSTRLIKSLFCAPLILQGELRGIIYLENNLVSSVFTGDKVRFLQHLSGQIVISIENTMVYSRLEEKIKQRTQDLEVSKEELKLLASIDPMTKLYNRRYFSEISEDIFNMNQRTNNEISLIMFDIDDFKSVNDTYGHHIGDKVIIGVANILLEHTRKSDIVCRFGGEEYIILLPDTDLESSMQIAQNIWELVEKMVITYDQERQLQVTISVGVSMVDLVADNNIEVAINKADNALYEAKRSGKNKVVAYKEKYRR
ncbi:diguanylate cyclase [Sulfurovum sp. XGS-02]|uniref:diguanylate cyclase n=1 Tax=Sulfurovum sp. XGS-02 TaxID=2925411 RepID=UPI00204BAC8F|nr:diguanylate cyclase [Sulfurovum sp. XGS-02]UPT76789.1 diguanylate cyclase [Sulfurovum sp. XGS-02]